MATGLEDGKIYLLERAGDLGAKTDWITAGGGDPDTIDTEQFTEGLTLCKFSFPMQMIKRGKTGAVVTVRGAGVSTDARSAERFYNAIVMGKTSSKANAHLIDKFLMSDRHTSGATATFVRYHLIIYYGTNNHEPFTDDQDNRVSYCTGIVTDFEAKWAEPAHINMDVRINWWSVWPGT